jgi:hypothetical protein
MSWNWLDIVVVLLIVGQIGFVVAIGMIAVRIKNGPLARFSTAVGRNISAGKKLVETGQKAGMASLPHILRTRAALMRLPTAFRPVTLTDAPVTYASLSQPLALLGTFRGRKGTRKRVVKPGVAERLGLVPPAWKKITPYLGYLGTAQAVWQEVQKQLPEIKRALSERDSA